MSERQGELSRYRFHYPSFSFQGIPENIVNANYQPEKHGSQRYILTGSRGKKGKIIVAVENLDADKSIYSFSSGPEGPASSMSLIYSIFNVIVSLYRSTK